MGEDIVKKYASQLADLKINSKPLINCLTMTAEDYIRDAPVIVSVIEKHLATVRADVKLPVLYLIDSIIKNVRKEYVELFTQNIVSTFCGVFEKVDEKTRGLLFKLRGTWKDYFPAKKLYAIDVRCRQIDPNWPITAPAPTTGSIHVNPRFLHRGKQSVLLNPEQLLAQSTSVASSIAVVPPLDTNVSDVQMRAQLLAKQKELLELQTKKVELELLQAELQMKEKEQQHQIDITQRHEKMLMNMAEAAKNRTAECQQQLSSFQHKPTASTSSASSSSSTFNLNTKPILPTKNYDSSSSDRESHHSHSTSISSKHSKSHNSEQSSSSVDGSPSKKSKSSSRDKSERDRKDKSKGDKSSKDKDNNKHDKESRHSRRDKSSSSRHEGKDKSRSSHESRSRESSSSVSNKGGGSSSSSSVGISSGGEWKDYNEAKKLSSSPPKKVIKREVSDEDPEPTLDIKPPVPSQNHRGGNRTPSPIPSKSGSIEIKSPVPSQTSPESVSSGGSSPLKRRFPKGEKDKERGHKDKESKNQNQIPSDPRIRRRMERERSSVKVEEKCKSGGGGSASRESPTKTVGEWKDYHERQKAVLRRSYRKTPGIDVKEDNVPSQENISSGNSTSADTGIGSDVDLRFEAHMDVDLRSDTAEAVGGDAPPSKKSKHGKDSSNTSSFDEAPWHRPIYRIRRDLEDVYRSRRQVRKSNRLFGHQDVDLRAGATSCWTQVKVKGEISENALADTSNLVEDERKLSPPLVTKILRSPPQQRSQGQGRAGPAGGGGQRIMRSPGPTSPNGSMACDPLGRPLIYNRLPNDPEERKRSLDSRSSSIDPIEQFRVRYLDRALQASGQLSNEDIKMICVKAKEELDQGFLNNDQYVALMRQIVQDGSKVSEAIALREAQQMQMQMKDSSWRMPKPNDMPNPWVAATENTENNIWAAAAHPPGMRVPDFPMRFPGPPPPNHGHPGSGPGSGPNAGGWDNRPPWMQPNMPPVPEGPNPFEEAIARPMPMAEDLIPPANPKDLKIAEVDVGRTIPIDKVTREVRFYRDLSVIFMGMMNDDPRELSFQKDDMPRRVLINGKPLEIYLGETKKFDLNRVPHTLRIGSPGRELVLDDRRYELFFGGGTKKIFVDGRSHSFQLLQPSPQVTVGGLSRHDLCAGRVILTVDAVSNFSVYLDEKLQKIDVVGEPVVLRFSNGFQMVHLNGRPFPTNFGARLPFSITLPGHGKHFLRFAAISPETERGIELFLQANYGEGKSKDNIDFGSDYGYGLAISNQRWSVDSNSNSKRALLAHNADLDLDLELTGRAGPGRGMMRGVGPPGQRGAVRGARGGRIPMDVSVRPPGPNPWESEGQQFENMERTGPGGNMPPPQQNQANPLDLLNNMFLSSTPDPYNKNKNNFNMNHSYESDMPGLDESSKEKESDPQNQSSDPAQNNNLNVTDLVANLIKFGLLPASGAQKPQEEETEAMEEVSEEKNPEEKISLEDKKDSSSINSNSNGPKEEKGPKGRQSRKQKEKEKQKLREQQKEKEREKEMEAAKTIPPLPFVDLAFTDNLRERRDIVLGQISTGVQCSQCGLRFPPDQTLRYSQHLDWHFRKNRREKANAKKALSRKWYYDLSDWIQFEEIEDLEERAASLFESQEAENENDPKSPNALLNPEQYTVLASSHEGAVCPQCGETFESFFDEEREEWRLKNAKLDDYEGEQKLYHPICHQDYLGSLVEEPLVEETADKPSEEYNPEESIEEGEPTKAEGDQDHPVEIEGEVDTQKEEEEDDEVLIIKEGKKEVVVMEIDIDDDIEKTDCILPEKNCLEGVSKENSNVTLTEQKKTDIETINVNENSPIVIDGEMKNVSNSCNTDSSCLDANLLSTEISIGGVQVREERRIASPILIDEDSTFLPGLTDETQEGVFGIALNSGTQIRVEAQEDEKRILYEAMKFDFPPIKVEPVDEDDGMGEEIVSTQDDFLSTQSLSQSQSQGEEPMNIDLTEEDSTDGMESGARLITQLRTSIDGNLQHEDAATLPFIPAAKIKINLFGQDNSPVSSPLESKEKTDSVQQAQPISRIVGGSISVEGTNTSPEEVLKDDGNSKIVSISTEINKDDIPDQPIFTEEMKRLKPRLVGRKLTNYPPKFKGKEESGLCSIV